MDKEKLYQTNIYNLLSALEEKIKSTEYYYDESKKSSGINSYACGNHLGAVRAYNSAYCAIKELQLKTFHGKEFKKTEIEETL